MSLKLSSLQPRTASGGFRSSAPFVLNAINGQLVREVTAALNMLVADPSTRVIVLSGEGRALSGGFDLKESAANNYWTPIEWRTVIEADFEFIMQFWECRKPTVPAIHGHCLAGGMKLALACDLSIAGADEIMGEPEVRFCSGIVAMLVPWIVGPIHAKDMLLTGNDQIRAEPAGAIGLVIAVVEAGEHLRRALEKAREIATAPPLSVELTKRAINRRFDIRGMRESLLGTMEIDILIESSRGEERTEFNRIRKEQGLRAAVNWRDSSYGKLKEGASMEEVNIIGVDLAKNMF